MRNRIVSLLMAVLLLCGLSVTAFAHDVPDPDRTGSIEITMRYDGDRVGGGSLSLYRVGEVHEDDGNYSFIPTGDFAGSGETLEDLESAKLAERLADYAEENKIKGVTEEIAENGNVKFEGLELGLYLLVQEEAAEGYNAASPFLVTVPQNEDGAYVYDVEASPKVQLTTAPDEPDEPDKPKTEKPKDEKLPQTGQLNWPVPLMAVSGLAVFALGWALKFGQKKDDYAE